jgi:hypothetical protein
MSTPRKRRKKKLEPVEGPERAATRTELLRQKLGALAPQLRQSFRANVETMVKSGKLARAPRAQKMATLELSEGLLGVEEALDAQGQAALLAAVLKPAGAAQPNAQVLALASPNGHELGRLQSELSRFETFIPRKTRP